MKNLKNELIKLGYQKPELRSNLRPILDKISSSQLSRRELENRKELAFDAGYEAAKKGLRKVPSSDRTYMQLIEDLPVGGGAADIGKAWTQGYNKFNDEEMEKFDW